MKAPSIIYLSKDEGGFSPYWSEKIERSTDVMYYKAPDSTFIEVGSFIIPVSHITKVSHGKTILGPIVFVWVTGSSEPLELKFKTEEEMYDLVNEIKSRL